MVPQTATKKKATAIFLYPTPASDNQGMGMNDLSGLYFVLNGRITYPLEGSGDLCLSAGQYNLVYPPVSSTRISAGSSQNNATTFVLHVPAHYLQNLVLSFPALSFFLEKIQKGIAARLSETAGIADPAMLTLIRNIRDCPYTGDLKKIYLELQTSTLIAVALSRIGGRAGRRKQEIPLKPQDIEKIQATRDYLLQNMEKPLTLIALAHKMGLNDFKLKKGYKQLYGATLFDDFLHARMEKARHLLLETSQSVVAIAELAGYKNVSSFSVAFKRYFGHTPGILRRAVLILSFSICFYSLKHKH
jgi:AraC-like DNA-binding protein